MVRDEIVMGIFWAGDEMVRDEIVMEIFWLGMIWSGMILRG